jgi:hypothetical protein
VGYAVSNETCQNGQWINPWISGQVKVSPRFNCKEDGMTRYITIGTACLALVLTAGAALAQAPSDAANQAATSTEAAATAAKDSPELVGQLSKELEATPEQAAGAAGALFNLAKSRLKPEEFSQISSAVPGMDSLLKAAPSAGGAVGTTGALAEAAGAAGCLAAATSAFSQLGLKPDTVSKAVTVVTDFVSKSGNAQAASLLTGALK